MTRRPVPLPDWTHSISLEFVAPERNRYRSYRMQLACDLFGNWVLTRSWGRIGQPQRVRVERFAFRFDAENRARAIVRRRLHHGYRTTDAA